MKPKPTKIQPPILFLLALLLAISCSDGTVLTEPTNNEVKVTITQGAYGTVRFWEDDFMPIYDPETGGTISQL